MKNFVLFALACLLSVVAFLHFNQENEIVDLSSFTSTIADQNICIDELEESLYDFSTENGILKMQLTSLTEENTLLSKKVVKFERQIARLRKRVTNLELDVNSARTKFHILKSEKSNKVEAKVVNNPVEMESISSTNEMDLFEQIIADAKNDLKRKKQALSIVKKELINKEAALSITKEQLTKKEEAIDFKKQQLEESKMEELKLEVLKFEEPIVPTFSNPVLVSKSTKKVEEDSKDEPKLYFVESVDKKEIKYEGLIASASTDSEFSSKSPVYNLVENTVINYEYLSCRRDKFGKKIKKLNTKGKNWKFTFIQFNMENPVFSELLDQSFRIKIKDLDNDSYVQITTNRLVAYDNCHDFTYEGEPIQLAFYHENDKEGLNYNVEIFLLDGEEEYLIEESTKDIFSEGISLDSSL